MRLPKIPEGFKRTYNKCSDCKHIFVRQFIPYSLGQGQSFGMCLCQLTAHRPSTIATRAEWLKQEAQDEKRKQAKRR